MNIETRPIESLRLHPRNRSVRPFFFLTKEEIKDFINNYSPLIINKKGEIIDGVFRFVTLESLNVKEVKVIVYGD